MSNHTCNSILSEHSCGRSRNHPPATEVPLLKAGASALKNLLSWTSFGQHGATVLESTSCPLTQKRTCSVPEGDGVISEDDRLAKSQLQMWDSRGMEDSELAGETSSFSPSFPLPPSPQIHL